MARTLTKSAGDPWPDPGAGDTIVLLAGIHRPAEFSAIPDLTLQGQPGAIVSGSLTPRGSEPQCTLRFHDQCHGLRVLGPLEIVGSYGRGLRVTGSERMIIADINSHGHGIECIETGDCPNAAYLRLVLWGSRPENQGDQSYPKDKRHALYISGKASGSVVEDLHAYDVTGSGFQANGPGMGAVIRSIHVRRMLLERCGSGGTPPISLMGVQDSLIEEFEITDVASDRWAVLFADGMGEQFACRGNAFRVYSVPVGSHPAEEEGSGNNTYDPGPGWSPSPVIPPPPPVNPTPDLPAARAALQDATAALGKAEEGNDAMAGLIQGVARRALKKSLAETNAGEALNLRDAKSAVARARRAVGEG